MCVRVSAPLARAVSASALATFLEAAAHTRSGLVKPRRLKLDTREAGVFQSSPAPAWSLNNSASRT
jgi:hypothetical protein